MWLHGEYNPNPTSQVKLISRHWDPHINVVNLSSSLQCHPRGTLAQPTLCNRRPHKSTNIGLRHALATDCRPRGALLMAFLLLNGFWRHVRRKVKVSGKEGIKRQNEMKVREKCMTKLKFHKTNALVICFTIMGGRYSLIIILKNSKIHPR